MPEGIFEFMRSRNSGIARFLTALALSVVQLLSAAWVPVVHAQMSVPSQATAFADVNSPESTPVHDQTLCYACSASHVYGPQGRSCLELTITSREYTCLGASHTTASQRHLSTANAIRAPPLTLA